MTKNSKLIHERRLQQQDQSDQGRNKYVSLVETLKVFDATNQQLNQAVVTEKKYIQKKNREIQELREILREETKQRDQFLQTAMLQRKQIGTLTQKHEKETAQLERGLSIMNEGISDCIKTGATAVTNLENSTMNLNARQQSQFSLSKYQMSKISGVYGKMPKK